MSLLLPFLNDRPTLLATLLGQYDDLHDLCDIGPILPKKIRKHSYAPYNKSLRSTADKKNFTINIDVQQFSPEEISVKSVNDDCIVVECKHEEKPDEHGSIYRHFVRRYKVPKGHDVSKTMSKLSSDGVLTVTCPKVEKNKKYEIEIPITFTNQPSQLSQTSSSEDPKQESSKKVKE